MQAVILSAGLSSRFYPYNTFGHKSLVTLGGQTLLGRTLKNLKKAHIENVIIVENIDEAVSKKITPFEKEGMNIKYVIQENATGMGDALLCASKYLENSFFVLSAYHFEINEFIKEMTEARSSKSDAVLLTRECEDVSGFGVIKKINGKVRVLEKKEKGTAEKVVGIYLLNKEFIALLHNMEKQHYSFETALSSYSDNNTIVLVNTKKQTLSLKYPWDLLHVKDYYLKNVKRRISRNTKIAKNATIRGNVIIEDGAVVMDGAVIIGPAYIGENSYIGTNSIIRGGACIEEGVVVGAHMEVKNAILMKKVTTHSGFIGDSIIGENTKIAAGFYSANVRLDRKDIKVLVKGEKVDSHMRDLGAFIGFYSSLGIKVGTMPGVIIGNKVVVGPGSTVMENIEDNVTYYTEIRGIIKKPNKQF